MSNPTPLSRTKNAGLPSSTVLPNSILVGERGAVNFQELLSRLSRATCISRGSPLACRSGAIANSAWRSGAESRSEEHTSELQSQSNLVCRLLLEKKNLYINSISHSFSIYNADLVKL